MRLKTERLLLRDFLYKDVDDLYQIFGDEKTMRFSEPPYTYEKTKTFLKEFCIKKKSAFAVYHNDEKKVIGYLLFKPIEATVYELGWFFNRHYWGKGYAYEACSKVIHYGFTILQLSKIQAETIDSIKSINLMNKLGMKCEGIEKIKLLNNEKKEVDLYRYSVTKNPLS